MFGLVHFQKAIGRFLQALLLDRMEGDFVLARRKFLQQSVTVK